MSMPTQLLSRRPRLFRRRAVAVGLTALLAPLLGGQPAEAQLPPLITIPGTIFIPPVLLIYVNDVSSAITDNLTTVEPNAPIVTKITVTNRSSATVSGIGVLYSPPPALVGSIWACSVGPGESCGGSTTGSGAISRSITLTKGASAVFTVSSAVGATATGTITSKVTVVPPGSLGDTVASNNEATDTTTIPPPATTTAAATTTTAAPTTTAAATTTTIAVVPPSTATAAPTTVAATPTVAPTTKAPPPAATADGFQSPTGGIQCLYTVDGADGATLLRCYVANSTAKLPKRPASCDFDWEDIGLGATGKAFTVCAGDTVEGNYPVVPYGKTWTRGVFTCSSAKSGVTCRNASKRGFRISRTKRTSV